MTKTQNLKPIIESNRKIITDMLYSADSVKRLNNINWLRHEISFTEPRILFHLASKEQVPYLDFNNMSNIGPTYDYIVNNPNEPIDTAAILRIHQMLCRNTNITGTMFRTSNKILEITLNNGCRLHAPSPHEIEFLLNEILYKINSNPKNVLHNAFDIHYELIALQPFDDFNKRTARLIMNWILIQGGYRPIVFNKRSDKQDYRNAIANRANGQTKKYYEYMESCLARTQREIISQLKKSKLL